MTKEYLENILTEYGVAFTDSLADRLLKEFEPSNDMVSRGVFEQVMCERDVATEQLKELGYELGQKVEPCEDAINRKQAIYVARGYCHPANVARELAKLPPVNPQNCDKCEVGNPCLYCRHEFEPQERSCEPQESEE